VASRQYSTLLVLSNRENRENKDYLYFISGKRKWELPPSFCLLGTLTGLRDRAWGQIA